VAHMGYVAGQWGGAEPDVSMWPCPVVQGSSMFSGASAFVLVLQLMTSEGIYTEELSNNRCVPWADRESINLAWLPLEYSTR
jgi:hypothetical protein